MLNVLQAPSKRPTKTPTQSPTRKPSKVPTQSPTTLPSQQPSLSPSKQPTGLPTQSPSKSPTGNPTFSPSAAPTQVPTAPTQGPSGTPSGMPSAVRDPFLTAKSLGVETMPGHRFQWSQAVPPGIAAPSQGAVSLLVKKEIEPVCCLHLPIRHLWRPPRHRRQIPQIPPQRRLAR